MSIKEELLITKFNKEDFEETFGVFKITIPFAFKEDGGEHLVEMIKEEIEGKKELLTEILDDKLPNKIFLVAKYEGKIIGTIAYGPSGEAIRGSTNNKLANVGELGSLYVLPDFHNIGVATALVNALIKQLNELGIKEFCLDSGFGAAQRKWTKKFGKPYVIAKDYWGEGVDNMVWYCRVEEMLR